MTSPVRPLRSRLLLPETLPFTDARERRWWYNYRGAGGWKIADGFDRADSTTTMGTTPTGQAWTPLSGTWGVSGGKAYLVTATPDAAVVTDTGVADVDARVTVTAGATGVIGLAFRATDASNYWRLVWGSSTTIVLQKYVAGARTTLATATSVNIAVGFVLAVRCVGSAITATLNGVALNFGTVTDAFNATATKHGLDSNANTDARFGPFIVVRAP